MTSWDVSGEPEVHLRRGRFVSLVNSTLACSRTCSGEDLILFLPFFVGLDGAAMDGSDGKSFFA